MQCRSEERSAEGCRRVEREGGNLKGTLVRIRVVLVRMTISGIRYHSLKVNSREDEMSFAVWQSPKIA
eukprot:757678-Hanusia_phi.AAC.2